MEKEREGPPFLFLPILTQSSVDFDLFEEKGDK
jgi:hypothetical protein